MSPHLFLIGLVSFILCLAEPGFAQSKEGAEEQQSCGQEAKVQDPLVEEAEQKQFTIRRVEIAGNTTIRHREFVKRFRKFNEGYIFTRRSFERSIKNIAKMKSIYPITNENVEIRLDREHGDVDIVFCVKQRP